MYLCSHKFILIYFFKFSLWPPFKRKSTHEKKRCMFFRCAWLCMCWKQSVWMFETLTATGTAGTDWLHNMVCSFCLAPWMADSRPQNHKSHTHEHIHVHICLPVRPGLTHCRWYRYYCAAGSRKMLRARLFPDKWTGLCNLQVSPVNKKKKRKEK